MGEQNGRIAIGEAVAYTHKGPQGETLIQGRVTRFFHGSNFYEVQTDAKRDGGRRYPPARTLERQNPGARRASTESEG